METFDFRIDFTVDTSLPFAAGRFAVTQRGPGGDVVIHQTRAITPDAAEAGVAAAHQEAEMVASAAQAALSAALPGAEVRGPLSGDRLPAINVARAFFGLGAL